MQDKNHKLSAWLYIFCTVCWVFCAVMNFIDKSFLIAVIESAAAIGCFAVAMIHFNKHKQQNK